MRAVVQRVSSASVSIDGSIKGEIGPGLLVLLGINKDDTSDTVRWMCNKIVNLRIFPDNEDKMNRSVLDIKGGILLISNFTVYGDVNKGFRPNFMYAAPPEIAEPLYNQILQYLRENYDLTVQSGIFGAMMDISLTNSGPVTIILDKDKERNLSQIKS